MALLFPAASEGAIFRPPAGSPATSFTHEGGLWRARDGWQIYHKSGPILNVAAITVSLPDPYRRIRWQLQGLSALQSAAVMYVQTSSDNAASWLTTYNFGGMYAYNSGTPPFGYGGGAAGVTQLQIGATWGVTAWPLGFVMIDVDRGMDGGFSTVNWRTGHYYSGTGSMLINGYGHGNGAKITNLRIIPGTSTVTARNYTLQGLL